MNAQSNAIPESAMVSPAALSGNVAVSQRLYWSVLREIWENRSLYIAPLAAAGLFLFGFLISLRSLPAKMRALPALDAAQQKDAIQGPYLMVTGLLMLTGMLVAVFYCLDALYGERRDRSILFWKSLPVSDVLTVLSKASIPIFLLQFFVAAIIVVTQTIMLLVSSAVLRGNGQSAAALWTLVPWLQLSFIVFWHLVILHGLWHAPFYGWFLMISSWARRAPFVWAILPPIAVGIVEKVAFNTSYFGNMLLYQLGGSGMGVSHADEGKLFDMLGHFDPGKLLSSPALWIGLAITALFLFAAIRLRRQRGPI